RNRAARLGRGPDRPCGRLRRAALHLRRSRPPHAAGRYRRPRRLDRLSRAHAHAGESRRLACDRRRLRTMVSLLPGGRLAGKAAGHPRQGHLAVAGGLGAPPGQARAGACAGPARARALVFRARRQPVGRGEGARPLRAHLRGRPGRGSAPRRPRSRAGAASRAPAGRADALRSPPHPRHRDRAAARQAQIPSRYIRADGARIHPHRAAAHRGGDLGAPPAQAEFPPLGCNRGPGRADRRNLDRDRGAAGGAVPLPPRGRAGAPRAGAALGGARVVTFSLPSSPVRWREAGDDAFIGLSPKPGETDLAIVSFANGPFLAGRPLSTVPSSTGPGPLRGHSPATAALFLRQIGGPKLRSKEMGLVFEFAFCGVRLPGCVGKCGRRAGVVSGRPRGAARRQRGDFRFACGVPTARLVATRSELLVATRYALGRDLPREWKAVAVPPAAGGTPEQLWRDNQPAAPTPAQMTQQNEARAPQQETPALPPVAEERQIPAQRSEVAAPPQETPAPPPLAEEQHIGEQRREAAAPQQETSPSPPVVGERHIPKPRREAMAPGRERPPAAEARRVPNPAAEAQLRAAAPKKPASEDRAAKQRPTNEALNAVRRFQDDLRDIPVSAYTADGTRRTIVIRPTSIQDVYYYSTPR